jgi:hypothetical protein
MTIRTALTTPAVKRMIALTAVYVLALQALFGAGAQLRVMLAEAPGLCTILGFEKPDQPKHVMDACAVHCVGHASPDSAAFPALAMTLLALIGWALAQNQTPQTAPRPVLAFRGRGPPR